MTSYTNTFDKVGTRDWAMTIYFVSPITDGRTEGNTGIEGLDTGSVSKVYATRELALDGLPDLLSSQIAPNATAENAVLVSRYWQRESYTDDEFGDVEDAVPMEVTEQQGAINPDGTITWEPEVDVS